MDRSTPSVLVPKMLDRFPLMIPNWQLQEYEGFLPAGGFDIYLHVFVPKLPTVQGMKVISMSSDLEELMQCSKQELSQWLNSKSRQFFNFLLWLQNLAITKASNPCIAQKQADFPTEIWRDIISNLESFGYEHLSYVSENNLSLLQLKVDSDAGTHFLDLKVESAISIKCQCKGLPEKAVSLISQQCSSIVKAFESFNEQIIELQPFWRLIREIDEEAWILDPLEPNLSHVRRQICIEPGLSTTVTLDPYNPLSQPDISFLGPVVKVEALQHRVNFQEWPQEEESLLKSLQEFLDVQFPSAPELESSQMSQDQMCNICFDSEGLDRMCELCNGQFHEACLLGWLQSVPSNQMVFNRISGQCPLCKQTVSCVMTGK